MYLLYVDDSGSANDDSHDHVVLAGVAAFERQTYFLSTEMDRYAEELFPSYEESVEFHASEAFSANTEPWTKNNGKSPAEKKQPLLGVLDILAKAHESVCAFGCVVNKKNCSGDPYETAFEQICNRFDLFLERINRDKEEEQRGLLIADESKYEKIFQSEMLRYRDEGNKWRRLRYFAEVPLFVDSRASRMVQIADHIAYAIFRRYEKGDTSYLDRIVHRFDHEGYHLHGLVHRDSEEFYDCCCPACLSRKVKKHWKDDTESV